MVDGATKSCIEHGCTRRKRIYTDLSAPIRRIRVHLCSILFLASIKCDFIRVRFDRVNCANFQVYATVAAVTARRALRP